MTAMRRNTTQRPGTGTSSSHILIHVVLIFFALSAVLPFGYMFISSFKYYKDLVENPGKLAQSLDIEKLLRNLGQAGISGRFFEQCDFCRLSYSCRAFHFRRARLRLCQVQIFWKGRNFFLLLGTMMVPFSVVLVPLYITITRMGLANQLGGIIVTGLWSSFGLFMMRQFIETIPSELLDAACIDGASEWRIFLR